jgi:hypothetical protein
MITPDMRLGTGLRAEVWEFAQAMEVKLKKNDHKTGWQQLPIEALRRLMMLEVEEFNVAREFFGADEAMNELVDIANFAMMLRDRLRIEKERKSIVAGPELAEYNPAWSHGK